MTGNALTPFDFIFGRPMAPRPSFPRLGNMATDIHEEDGKVVVDMEIPGADTGSFDITFEGDELRVTLEKRSERNSEDGRYSERSFGTYSRTIHLGENIDADAIEAEYHDGVLTITAPRTEEAKPRRIEVKGASEKSLWDGQSEQIENGLNLSDEEVMSGTVSEDAPAAEEKAPESQESGWDSVANKE